jgi:hypothetical protein
MKQIQFDKEAENQHRAQKTKQVSATHEIIEPQAGAELVSSEADLNIDSEMLNTMSLSEQTVTSI